MVLNIGSAVPQLWILSSSQYGDNASRRCLSNVIYAITKSIQADISSERATEIVPTI